MPFDPARHHRKSIRLRGYDYSQDGAYFVTVCARDRRSPFGVLGDGTVHPNHTGRLVADSWTALAVLNPFVILDAWVLMPDHLHGLVILDGGGHRKPLGRVIGAFKTQSTRRVNESRGTPGDRLWQRGFYEHIVRDQEDLDRIRRYIIDNPARSTAAHRGGR